MTCSPGVSSSWQRITDNPFAIQLEFAAIGAGANVRFILHQIFRFVIPSEAGNLLLPREKRYCVYIMASKGRVLYTGVTGFLMVRVLQHKSREHEGFTQRYHIDRLVYYEIFRYVNNAIARQTQIKGWSRAKKVALIEKDNPTWEDLAADWGKPAVMRKADSSLRSE